MSGSVAWLSRMRVDSTLIKYFSNDEHFGDLKRAADHAEMITRGVPVPREAYPAQIFATYGARKHGPQPHLFATKVGYVVSEMVAQILQKADLGRTGLYPVAFFQHDRTTPVEGSYYFLHVAEAKRGLLPLQSSGLRKPHENVDLWAIGYEIKDDEVILDSCVVDGVDAWLDPQLRDGVFLSDRLVQALKAAKLDKKFRLLRCRIAND